MSASVRHPVSHADALTQLRAGNQRFTQNLRRHEANRGGLNASRPPSTIVLSCSDAQLPPESVFDVGPSELFVVRVAGNIVAPSLVGSIEFAVATFGCELVVVLGHSRCSAIAATIEAINRGTETPGENAREIVNHVAPSISELVERSPNHPELMHQAIRANVRHSANHLRHASVIIERRIAEGHLKVVGAEYLAESGVVDFFDVP